MGIKKLLQSQIWKCAFFVAVSSLFFGLTNPTSVPSVLLIVGFLLFTAIVYSAVGILLAATGLYGVNLGKHKRRLTLLITGFTAGIIALQSIGELSQRDVLVLLPLILMAYLYLFYGRSKQDIQSRS